MLDKKAWLTISFQFIPKVLDMTGGRALCGLVKLFHTKLIKSCLYSPSFVLWATNRKGIEIDLLPNCFHRVGSMP